MRGHMGKLRVSQDAEAERGAWPGASAWFKEEAMGGGRRRVPASAGLHSANDCWAPAVWLVSGVWRLERGDLAQESAGKDLAGSMCFGLGAWSMKDTLASKPSTFSGH